MACRGLPPASPTAAPGSRAWASLEAKLREASTRNTPARPQRPEEAAVWMARELVSHPLVQRRLPRFESDRTSLTGGSAVVLGDGKGQYAVLALKHVPEATLEAAPAAAARQLEAAWYHAALHARAFAAEQAAQGRPEPRTALGIFSNVNGIEWEQAPPPTLRALTAALGGPDAAAAAGTGSGAGAGTGAIRRVVSWVLRWAGLAVGAASAAVLVGFACGR
ncbi:hypothetical protein ABPG75_004165 [Micractinium tetrahymenae]